MEISELNSIIHDIDFCGWDFQISEDKGVRFLQVEFATPDATELGKISRVKGRKWHLSSYMTKSEVVATAFKAVITALEHEAREAFRYRGRQVFGPHISVDALHEVANEKDVRQAPPHPRRVVP